MTSTSETTLKLRAAFARQAQVFESVTDMLNDFLINFLESDPAKNINVRPHEDGYANSDLKYGFILICDDDDDEEDMSKVELVFSIPGSMELYFESIAGGCISVQKDIALFSNGNGHKARAPEDVCCEILSNILSEMSHPISEAMANYLSLSDENRPMPNFPNIEKAP